MILGTLRVTVEIEKPSGEIFRKIHEVKDSTFQTDQDSMPRLLGEVRRECSYLLGHDSATIRAIRRFEEPKDG